jgi:hypothetical protein
MLSGDLSEATSGTWKVVDMRGKAMQIFLDHIYSGSVIAIQAESGVFIELLTASDKVQIIICLTGIVFYTQL